MNTDGHRWKIGSGALVLLRKRKTLISVFICVHLWTFLLLSCSSKPIDPRTAVPADALVYLETKDLGGVLKAITDNEAFRNAAKSVPDFSALNGMKLSVAVTGFQTSEEAVSDENAVLNFKPRFVAVVETNAWNYQALSFTENKLGEFINDIYDGEIELVTSDKHGGKYFIWTAKDGRKAYALVRGSLILFGNDESAIDKSMDVLNGTAESIAGNQKITAAPSDSVASGYISTDGVAQIANLAGISLAKASNEEGEVQSFIARVLPEMIRNSVTDVSWSAKVIDSVGIQDDLRVGFKPDVGKVISETIVPSTTPGRSPMSFLPADLNSVTRYDLKDPQIAWRSILLTAKQQTDAVSGMLIAGFSQGLLEPYGIEDPEFFLQGAESEVITMRFDPEGEKTVVIAAVKDQAKIRKSMGSKMRTDTLVKSAGDGWETLQSGDGETAAVFFGEGFVAIGDPEGVSACLKIKTPDEQQKTDYSLQMSDGDVSVTWTRDLETAGKIAEVIAGKKNADSGVNSRSIAMTRFNKNGMERRIVSDFGLIGMIIARLDPDN